MTKLFSVHHIDVKSKHLSYGWAVSSNYLISFPTYVPPPPHTAVRLGWCAIWAQVLAEVHALNERADIDSIVVQMPLPTGVDSKKVECFASLDLTKCYIQ